MNTHPFLFMPRAAGRLMAAGALTALLARQARRLPEKPQAGSHSMSPPASDARPRAARWLARLGLTRTGAVVAFGYLVGHGGRG